MPINRDDVISGYHDILGLPAPEEAKMQELLRTYGSIETFHRQLRESAECQRIISSGGKAP